MIVCFTSCICLYCQTLRYTCILLESFAFHSNLYMDSIVFRDIYVYLLCWQFIHIPWNENLFLNENLVIHVYIYLCLNFMYMSILSKLLDIHVYPFEPRALMHIYLWTRCVWICMYILVYTWHTYALKKSSFDDFHVFEEYWDWMSIFMIICVT